MAGAMITTTDNPYNPFTQFDEWNAFDMQMGYNTCAYLSRILSVSHELTPFFYNAFIEEGIDEIIRINGTELYKKVYEE